MSTCVVLCQPVYGVVPALAHARLCEWFCLNVSRGLVNGYYSRINAYIDEARNILVGRVLDETPATHLFFVDQDVILPADALAALLAADAPCVSAIYFDKSEKHLPVGWSAIDPCVRMTSFEDGLAPVAGFGMGACLVRTELLRAMAAKYADRLWYRSAEGGEDLHFSRRLREMGVPFLLDGRVRCGHVADEVVTADHFHAARQRTA